MSNKTSRRRRHHLSYVHSHPLSRCQSSVEAQALSSRGTLQGCRVRVRHTGYFVGTREVAGAERQTRSQRGTVCSAGLQLITRLAGAVVR